MRPPTHADLVDLRDELEALNDSVDRLTRIAENAVRFLLGVLGAVVTAAVSVGVLVVWPDGIPRVVVAGVVWATLTTIFLAAATRPRRGPS